VTGSGRVWNSDVPKPTNGLRTERYARVKTAVDLAVGATLLIVSAPLILMMMVLVSPA